MEFLGIMVSGFHGDDEAPYSVHWQHTIKMYKSCLILPKFITVSQELPGSFGTSRRNNEHSKFRSQVKQVCLFNFF